MSVPAVAVVNVETLTEEERGRLVKALRECSNAQARAQGEREYVSETAKTLAKELKLPKKLVNRLIAVYHKQNFDEQVADHEQFAKLYMVVSKK